MPTIADLIFNADNAIIEPSNYRSNIPSKPGYYMWWAKEEEVKKLLNEHYQDFKLEPGSDELDGYYLIYYGISSSIRKRLNDHINQEHSDINVDKGYLSTFRQTISSLLTGKQRGEDSQKKTDEFIDKLKVQYFIVSKSWDDEVKKDLEETEKEAFKEYILPLNIRGNYNKKTKDFKKILGKIRKEAKIKS